MPQEKFTPEPLIATGTRVTTTDAAIVLAKVNFGADDGLTEHEARSYAAQLAASTHLLLALTDTLRALEGSCLPHTANSMQILERDRVIYRAKEALARCIPKDPGRPFRRSDNETVREAITRTLNHADATGASYSDRPHEMRL